jgi:hypothetical protein
MGSVRSAIRLSIVAAACVFAAAAFAGGPITKQNGNSPAFANFTSICTLPGFISYGFCNGDATTFTNVKGRIDAVQPKVGQYNLDLTFTNLTPGAPYRLWGNNGSFFVIGAALANASGTLKFSYQTSSPGGLGFDLNRILDSTVNGPGDVTVVTSYWSHQLLRVNPDTTLSAG